jgi:hypothetical protein
MLTPRGIAIAHLIDLYATSDMQVEPRQQLCVFLVQQVSEPPASGVIEAGLDALREGLAGLPTVLSEFDKRLHSTTEPDDLWTLMGSLNELLQPTLALDDGMGPIQLERSSVRTCGTAACRRCQVSTGHNARALVHAHTWQMLGLFVRRLHLAFRCTSFEEVCTVMTHFIEYKAAPAAVAPHVVATPAGEHGPMPPPWAYVLPAAQLESHVHALARRVEEGSVATSALVPQMAQLLQLAPHVPQVHYLQLLHHLHTRSYEAALESFHRYFDLLRAASAPAAANSTSTAKEATRAPTQWASLNLARLQLAFCQREQAVAAIQEAVRSAQQQEDNVRAARTHSAGRTRARAIMPHAPRACPSARLAVTVVAVLAPLPAGVPRVCSALDLPHAGGRGIGRVGLSVAAALRGLGRSALRVGEHAAAAGAAPALPLARA